jgi:hypothetical protein
MGVKPWSSALVVLAVVAAAFESYEVVERRFVIAVDAFVFVGV